MLMKNGNNQKAIAEILVIDDGERKSHKVAVPVSMRGVTPSFRKVFYPSDRGINLQQKPIAQALTLGFVIFGGSCEFFQRRSEKPVVHFEKRFNRTSMAAFPSTAWISPALRYMHLAVHGDGGENLFHGGTHLAGDFLALTESEDGRTGAGDGETERTGAEGRAF
jgi:hypothetical protein